MKGEINSPLENLKNDREVQTLASFSLPHSRTIMVWMVCAKSLLIGLRRLQKLRQQPRSWCQKNVGENRFPKLLPTFQFSYSILAPLRQTITHHIFVKAYLLFSDLILKPDCGTSGWWFRQVNSDIYISMLFVDSVKKQFPEQHDQ